MPPRNLAAWVDAHRHELAVIGEPGGPGRYFVGYPSRRPHVCRYEKWQTDLDKSVATLILEVLLRLAHKEEGP